MEHRDLPASLRIGSTPAAPDWRAGLPSVEIAGPAATLREILPGDAPSLLEHLGSVDVSRFIEPPPSVEAFDRYILRAHLERQVGRYACFVVVPRDLGEAVGLFQLRPLDAGFETAEWGFALGAGYWGSGLFLPCARQVAAFAFTTIGVYRLEARAAVANARCNGALRKLGAVQEGVLRSSCRLNGIAADEYMWSLLHDDWHRVRDHRSQVH